MACEDSEALIAIDAAILALAAGPAEVSGDAGSVKNHKISDLIAYRKYLQTQCSGISTSARRGLRIVQLIPPGSA